MTKYVCGFWTVGLYEDVTLDVAFFTISHIFPVKKKKKRKKIVAALHKTMSKEIEIISSKKFFFYVMYERQTN